MTVKHQVPLPQIDEVWDQVGGAKYFSAIDFRSGYHQIRLKEGGIQTTAFRAIYGEFEYLLTPFGLSNRGSRNIPDLSKRHVQTTFT